jgi:hypothetical protein
MIQIPGKSLFAHQRLWLAPALLVVVALVTYLASLTPLLAQSPTQTLSQVPAITATPTPTPTVLDTSASDPTLQEIILELNPELAPDATNSGSATPSATTDTEQRIQERRDRDITEPNPVQKGRLAAFLDENPPSTLTWNNGIQHGIRYAVNQGVQPNVIVLVLLFPLIASLIAASRHIIGLRGFGIYIPAVLSVALVSTGIAEGLIIFTMIALTSLATKKLVKHTKLSYLPRTALMIWTISLGILLTLILAPAFNLVTLMSVNIFPILILVLLAENFLDAQARMKQTEAFALAIETLSLAFISGLILQAEIIQKFALLQPEILLIGIAIVNILIGKFVGLRITEWLRFRSIIEEE